MTTLEPSPSDAEQSLFCYSGNGEKFSQQQTFFDILEACVLQAYA